MGKKWLHARAKWSAKEQNKKSSAITKRKKDNSQKDKKSKRQKNTNRQKDKKKLFFGYNRTKGQKDKKTKIKKRTKSQYKTHSESNCI